VAQTLENGELQAKLFKAGRLKHHFKFWSSITNDAVILSMIKDCGIELEDLPSQEIEPEPYHFPRWKQQKINSKITEMCQMRIIEPTDSSVTQFVSNIFTREKPDGSLRILLDLSEFNLSVVYRHFKMENLITAVNLMTPGCLMASIDWKDAYFSVSVQEQDRKYLRFRWNNKLFQFTCLPMGLASAPRLFTKLAKVLFAQLRKKGHLNTFYIDDSLLFGDSLNECRHNVKDTVQMAVNAGFVVHPQKSVLEPNQCIVYLGFILNSREMTVRLTDKKVTKIKAKCSTLLHKVTVTIQELTVAIGCIVASFPGVQYGPMHYRMCDNFKNKMLKENCGNFSAKVTLTPKCMSDLKWWKHNIATQFKPVSLPDPHIFLESDASNEGWGGGLVTPVPEFSGNFVTFGFCAPLFVYVGDSSCVIARNV
jgi:hypothetical protein